MNDRVGRGERFDKKFVSRLLDYLWKKEELAQHTVKSGATKKAPKGSLETAKYYFIISKKNSISNVTFIKSLCSQLLFILLSNKTKKKMF